MRSDPTAEGLDWTSLRDRPAGRAGLLPPGTIVAALNWRDAGKIGYGARTRCDDAVPQRGCRQFGFAHPLADYAGQDVLLLVVDPAPRAADDASRWFRSVEVLAPASVRLNGRVLRTVTVLRGHGLIP